MFIPCGFKTHCTLSKTVYLIVTLKKQKYLPSRDVSVKHLGSANKRHPAAFVLLLHRLFHFTMTWTTEFSDTPYVLISLPLFISKPFAKKRIFSGLTGNCSGPYFLPLPILRWPCSNFLNFSTVQTLSSQPPALFPAMHSRIRTVIGLPGSPAFSTCWPSPSPLLTPLWNEAGSL